MIISVLRPNERIIELNSNTAQQDVRRVDYYSGN